MNPNNPNQILQQGFRIAIGAVASLVEAIQDPDKRAEAIADLQMEFNQKIREWAAKGAVTEQEARTIIDDLLARQNGGRNEQAPKNQTTQNPVETTSSRSPISTGLRELQNDLVALKLELIKLREEQEK